MPRSLQAMKIGIIGAGRLGTSLAAALAGGGLNVVAVGSRSAAAAVSVAAVAPGARGSTDLQEVANEAGLVFITTPDAAIAQVAGRLRWRPGQLAVHCSGALTLEALEAARIQGAAIGCFYPLQTFAQGAGPDAWHGITVALEGDADVAELLSEMARRLGGHTITLAAGQKALYHTAAVFASNYTVTLVAVAVDLWRHLGFEEREAMRGLLPILRGAVGSLERLGLPGALTGPIARGDTETIRKHLGALHDLAPDYLELYRALAAATLPIALAQGGLRPGQAAALRSMVGG